MPAPRDQPRWPETIPWSPRGPAPGRWRSRGEATSWTEQLYQRIEGPPAWSDRRRLAVLALGRPRRQTARTEGAMAQTEQLEYHDGTRAIRKTFPGQPEKASAEYLASLVAQAIGAPAPAVVRDPTDPDEAVIMGYVPGDPGTVHTGQASADEWGRALYYLAQTRSGLLIGLLDVLIGNADRHADNWRLSSEIPEPNAITPWRNAPLRQPVAIDHSEVLRPTLLDASGVQVQGADGRWYPAPMELGTYEGFLGAWLRMQGGLSRDYTGNEGVIPGVATYKTNPLHPDDVLPLRVKLLGLRRHFEEAGMLEAHQRLMARFEAVAAHASGTERMYPGG